MGIIFAEVSSVVANLERIRRERSNVFIITSKFSKEFMFLLKIFDFEKIREKVENE